MDGNGLPLVTLITPGQAGDSPMFLPLMAQLRVGRDTGRPRTRPDAVRVLQWVPFLTVLVLHAIYRARRANRGAGDQPTVWALSAMPVRGRGKAILRTSLLALVALVVACFAPILIAGSAGLVDLGWGEGATTAALLTLPVALIFMIPVAGEELAWRGYITTLLSPRGFATTTVVIAALWAAWHLPLTLAYSAAGELAPRDVVSKTVDLLLAAVLVSALRYLSESVWPAVFAHALFNNLFQMAQYNFMTPLSQLSDGNYWGYMAISWITWLAIDAVLVLSVVRVTRRQVGLGHTRQRDRRARG